MSKELRKMAAQLRQDSRAYPVKLQAIPVPAAVAGKDSPQAAWRSNRFLVQLFDQDGAQRITINRTAMDETTGRWLDGITWDEIQNIKREIGFADHYAIELFPADADVVNLSNMRHIWLVDAPAFAWRRKP